MGGVSTAELGNHSKEHDRNGFVVEKRRSYIREKEWNSFIWKIWYRSITLLQLLIVWSNLPSSALKVSLMTFHSGLSVGSSCWIVSTMRYIMLSSTLRSVLSAREMAGFLTALLQAALLLKDSKWIIQYISFTTQFNKKHYLFNECIRVF